MVQLSGVTCIERLLIALTGNASIDIQLAGRHFGHPVAPVDRWPVSGLRRSSFVHSLGSTRACMASEMRLPTNN